MTTPPEPGNGSPAEPSDPKATVPSNPQAPEKPKSDIERLAESKEKWKADAIAAQAELEKLRKEKEEEATRKLKEKEDFKTLAEQKEAEAKAATDKLNAAELRLKDMEDQQEAELQEVLTTIPAEKHPPLDPLDPVSKRLRQAKYAASLFATKKPDDMSGGLRKQPDQTKQDRFKELTKKAGRRTEAETQEMLALDQELKGE